jgi:hypothetical protein
VVNNATLSADESHEYTYYVYDNSQPVKVSVRAHLSTAISRAMR